MSEYGFYFGYSPEAEQAPGKLYLRVSRGGISRTLATHYRIWPQEWDSGGGCLIVPRDNTRRKRQLMSYMTGMFHDLQRIGSVVSTLEKERRGVYTVDEIVQRYGLATETCAILGVYAEQAAEELRAQGGRRRAEYYHTAVSRLRSFTHNDIRMEQITVGMMNEYQRFLKSEGCSGAVVSFYLRTLKAIYLKAINEGVIPQNGESPFEQLTIDN